MEVEKKQIPVFLKGISKVHSSTGTCFGSID